MIIPRQLSDKQVQRLKEDGVYPVGGARGLYLRVRGESRAYILRYTSPVTKKVRQMSVGLCSIVSLAEARAIAHEHLRTIAGGMDPADEKDRAAEIARAEAAKRAAEEEEARHTFAVVAEEWFSSRLESGYYANSPRGAGTTRSMLDRLVLPSLGQIPVADLSVQVVFDCIRPIWISTSATRKKVLTTISAVHKWSVAKGYARGENPASLSGPLRVLIDELGPCGKPVVNHPALHFDELPEFMRQLMEFPGAGAKALAFSILMAARSKPVREMLWRDVDLDAKEWRIPVANNKVKSMGVQILLLSDAACDLLRDLPRISEHVFPSPYHRRALSDVAVEKVIAAMHERKAALDGVGWIDRDLSKITGKPERITQHGTARATFKTWTRTGENRRLFDEDAVERCMMHKVSDGYGGAYDRAHLIDEQRVVINAWGSYCMSLVGCKDA